MLTTFSLGDSFKFITTTEANIGNHMHIFSRNNISEEYMSIISADRLFCYDKFEQIPNEKVINLSKLTK